MKYLLAIFILAKSSLAWAPFSEFVVVEPGSEHIKWLSIAVEIDEITETCLVYFETSISAWLVESSKKLSKREQIFRAFFMRDKPAYVESFSLLENISGNNKQYAVTVSTKLSSRSYIYIDFPEHLLVLDGGYYYSIPLGEHCAEKL